MPILLKIFIAGLLLVLLAALGTEVVALHRPEAMPDSIAAPPVVVRKAPAELLPRKIVHRVPGR